MLRLINRPIPFWIEDPIKTHCRITITRGMGMHRTPSTGVWGFINPRAVYY